MKRIFAILIIICCLHVNTTIATDSGNDTQPLLPESSPASEILIETEKDAPFDPTQNEPTDTATPTEEIIPPTVTEDPMPQESPLISQPADTSHIATTSTVAHNDTPDKHLAAAEPLIRINEILADPANGYEFIELYNDSDAPIDLSGWYMCDLSTYDKTMLACNKTHANKFRFQSPTIIAAHDFLTIYNKTHFKFGLNNTDEEIFLEDASMRIVARYAYKFSHKGISWNYAQDWYEEDPTPQKQNNLNPLTKNYPQLQINEIFPHPADAQEQNEFIEIHNPFDEPLSLKNWRLKDGSQSGIYTFSPKTLTSCATLPDTCMIIPAQGFLAVYRNDYSFALNDSGNETVSLIAPNGKITSVIAYASSKEGLSYNTASSWYWGTPTPNTQNAPDKRTLTYPQIILNEIMPNPLGDESQNEYIELYNPTDQDISLHEWILRDASGSNTYTFSTSQIIPARAYLTIYRKDFLFALNNSNETVSLIAPNEKIIDTITYSTTKENISYNYDRVAKKWRWSKHLTPDDDNAFNNMPMITRSLIKKTGYKNTWTAFSAKAKDADHEKLKVRWDFGDGSRSYLWSTRHKYKKSGTYYGSLRIQDASEEIVIPFVIKIRKFPSYELHITEVMPNPHGKDTDSEYIIITNSAHKKISLEQWSIATGSSEDRLVNHPLNKKIVIQKNDTKRITREHAAISLPNTTGIVELRAPDGTVIDSMTYLSQEKSVPDNAIYTFTDNTWTWLTEKTDTKNASSYNIATIASANENTRNAAATFHDDLFHMIHNKTTKDPTTPPSIRTARLVLSRLFMHINAFILDNLPKTHALGTNASSFPIYHQKIDSQPCKIISFPIFTANNHFNICPKKFSSPITKK